MFRHRRVLCQLLLLLLQPSLNHARDGVRQGNDRLEPSSTITIDAAQTSNDSEGDTAQHPTSHIQFIPGDHEPRIYLAAPSGVSVTHVMAFDRRNPQLRPQYRIQESDSQYFHINEQTGEIKTRRYIDQPVGFTYNIIVVAFSQGESDHHLLSIRVTEYNKYPPVFQMSNYLFDVDIMTPPGNVVCKVHAKDKDIHSYNSEVYYAFHQPHPLLTINRTSGEIILKEKLSRMTREIPVNLVAVDGGSPRRTGRSKLMITIKILSAPEEVTVVETGDKWAMICWKTPRSGVPLGYMIHLLSTKNPESNSTVSSTSTMSYHNISTNELGQRGGKICTALTNLDTKSTIEVQVCGWNEEERGMISLPVSFSTNVNNCQVNPCKHGICFVSESSSVGFICDCSPGYTGKLCDSRNLCYPNPCRNLGSCTSITASTYTCTCLPGFYGQDCELFNPCLGIQSPCQNGATCFSNSSNTYNCNCPEGYYGDSCENFNPCSRSPCQHGSLCSNISNSNYKCNCVPGYTGTHCEKDINECESSPCHNGSSCIDGLNSFVCSCPSGLKGKYCEINVDECTSLPCQNGGTCIDGIGSFKCHCAPGYEGLTCESNIDECLSNPCDNNATCIDGIDEYICNCEAGFEGDYCEEEIDECMNRPCVNGGSCRDALNDFECLCPAGFSGKLCEIDLDLCESNPCLNGGTCNDNTDHFSCSCLRGYHGRMCDSKDQCPNQMVKTDRGTFMWSAVDHGMLSRIRCPYGVDEHYAEKSMQFFKQADQNYFEKTGSSFSLKSLHDYLQESALDSHYFHMKKTQVDIFNKTLLSLHFDKTGYSYALRMCLQVENGSVHWGPVMDSVCRNEGFTQAAELSHRLEELTKDPFLIDTKIFLDTSKELLNVVDYALSDRQIAQSMVSIISNMMEVNESVLEEGDKNGTVSQGLVQLIDTYTSKAKIQSKENISIKSSNIALEVNEVDAEESNTTQGIPFVPMHLSKANQSKWQNQSLDIAMKVPMQAVTEALKTSRIARVQFVSYRNSKFFRPISIYKDINNLTNDGFIFNMNQTVITAAISNTTVENLTELLVYSVPNEYGKLKQSCVYWDPYTLDWLQDGLSTNQTDEKVKCESTHLTAFSVLLDADPSYYLPEEHKEALSIISYIGSVFSIIGLLLTIITYSLFRCLNRDRSGKILLNLCLSLLLMNLSFLLITIKDSISIVNLCMAVAMLTHYFVLTSLSWMLVEAVNMYQLLITVFATSETNFMIKRILCAWGIPLIIVTATAVYDVAFYYNTQPDYCLVSKKQPYIYYISYFGPCCFILGVNCVVFILVSCVLCQKRTTGKVGGQVENGITIAQVRGAFTVMTLLGVTWVFGVFTIAQARLVFQYIFSISNSLQGFIIFIVRCVQYPEARIAWMTLIRTGKLKKHRGGIPSSSVGNSNSRNTVSSGTYSQSTRKLSLDTNSGSNTSLWNRFRTRENRNKQRTSRYSTWGLRNVFWSSKENANDTKIFPRTTELCKNDIKGNIIDATPISETLKRELEKSFLNRPTISRTQSMHVKGYMSADTCSSFKRVGSLMCATNGHHNGEPNSNTTGSQDSLTTKEGEDTSWQFLRAPPDGMAESKLPEGMKLKKIPFIEDTFQVEPPVSLQKNTNTHPEKAYYKAISHSDQGYMSGIGTAEHSPESPRQKSRQISKPLLETDSRLTVSTPDNLCTTTEDYKDESEMNIQQKEIRGISAKSDGEIIHQGKDMERFDDMVPSHTFVVINGQKIYTNNPSVRLNLEQMLSGTEIDIECVDHCQLHKNCSNMNFPSREEIDRKCLNNSSHPQKIRSSSQNVSSSSPCDSYLADDSWDRLTRVQPHKRVRCEEVS